MPFFKSSNHQILLSRQGSLLFFLALLISLLSAYFAYTDKAQSLDWLYFDYTQQFSHLPPADDLVIIEIDDKSINALGRWPWPRSTHARLLEVLTVANAQAVVFDVLFPDIDVSHPESDQRFAQAIQNNNRVILPIHFEMLGQQGLVVESPPHNLFYSKVNALGHVHLEAEADGVIRSVFLKEGVGVAYWPHLSLALLEQLKPSSSEPLLVPGKRVKDLSQTVSPLNITRDYHNFLPMPSAGQGIRHYSYSDMINNVIDPNNLTDKLIFIGATAAGLGDILVSPVGNMNGVELNAWVFQALRHKLMIQNYSKQQVAVITFSVVLLCLLIMGRLSPRLFLLFSIFNISCLLALSSALLLYGSFWFPPASIVIGLALFFPLWSWLRAESVLRFLRQEIELLSTEISHSNMRVNRKRHAQQFLEQTGLLNITSKQQTPLGEQAIRTFYSGHADEHNIENFWQQQLGKYDTALNTHKAGGEGIELISRTISQLSVIKKNDLKHRQLIEKSLSRLQDAVCITDLCGEITFTNKRFKQWFDRDTLSEGLVSETENAHDLLAILGHIKLKSGLDWSQVLASLYQSGELFTGEATISINIQHSKKSASNYKITKNNHTELLCQASLVSINESHHDTLILTFTDITQLKAAENARADALSFLSHDLRSPMVSVLAILDNYQAEASDHQLPAETIESIKTLVSKNLNYAESFLQLSRADALLETKMHPCDLHAVLDGAQVFAHALASAKSIKVITQRCDDDAWVLGDLALLERTLNNLISNAIKFSPAGSQLTLILEKDETEVQLSVVDQGQGIAPADQSGLFERFTRLKKSESTEGAGLGLNFVATVVQKHHGKITLDSELSVGSKFTIHLPFLSENDLFI